MLVSTHGSLIAESWPKTVVRDGDRLDIILW